MPRNCTVTLCNSTFEKGSSIQFFRFPLKDVERCKKWIEAMEKKRLGSFKAYSDMQLKPDAIPSLLLPTAARAMPIAIPEIIEIMDSFTEKTTAIEPATIEFAAIEPVAKEHTIHCNEQVPNDLPTTSAKSNDFMLLELTSTADIDISGSEDMDCSERSNEESQSVKRKAKFTPRKRKMQKKIKLLQQTVRRQKTKITSMSQLLKELRKKV
ncbi:hypothetical protein ABEB36_015183 [Hypothenemus hampei]|uniref:THAP-type domain-containing protein n=1 Tax=Hypothenemus hampei TaxID=57062 RepID=A0ABD1E0M4_HYPHA